MPESTYAVVKCGGTQHRVEEGMTLLVDRMTGDEGASIDLEPLLYAGGKDTLDFTNDSSTPHDVVIEDSSGSEVARTDVITGTTTTTQADLKAGTYTFFCSVDGHREAGMEGTLTVK